jgi:hypothetical protein
MSVRARWPRLRAALAVAVGTAFWAAPPAHAEFGPIELVSKSAKEQADRAIAPAISADGRYVAFTGRIGAHQGVFRKDLQTGAIALVAEIIGTKPFETANPSISANGRYVAFTTPQQLDPADDREPASSDVYVADMNTTPPTYELASALDECDPTTSETPCGLAYAEPSGAVAASRVAISADGRSVAFLVRSKSNLTGNPEDLETPAGQVAVRELETDRTILITEPRAGVPPEPVPGGGADLGSEGAAISADGSTVAWVGQRLPEQVPMLSDEEAAVRAIEAQHREKSTEAQYYEPLWRRVPGALDQDPATRRIVGGGDPLAPGCPPNGTLADPACSGPFPEMTSDHVFEQHATEGKGWGQVLPALSANGETVATIGDPDEDQDLYVVDMEPGLSRDQAVRRLTKWAAAVPGESDPEKALIDERFKPLTGPILACAISPDGNRIAFSTARQVFPLAPPTLVTPAPPGLGTVAELYQVDLRGQTIERVTPGGGGGVSLGEPPGAGSPSYGDEGRLLAFSSTAFNLVAGDANGASDAFVVESPPPAPVGESAISHRPATLVVQPLWRMTVYASSLPNGRVRLTVGVPGSGRIDVSAAARLGRRLRLHRVASTHRDASAAGAQRLELRLPRKLRGLSRRKGGLFSQLEVGFSGPGGKPLRASLEARFLVHGSRKKKK